MNHGFETFPTFIDLRRSRATGCLLMAIILAFSTTAATAQNVFTVSNTNTNGPGSFSQAIAGANSTANVDANTPDVIDFDIAGGGVQTIRAAGPTFTFAGIIDPVVIDGTTQPGYSGTPIIVFDGRDVAGNNLVFGEGMQIACGGSTIRGVVIQGCGNNGIEMVLEGNNLIEKNFIGTDATGTIAKANGGAGISIRVDSSSNTIRDNLVSGNVGAGCGIQSGASNNVVENNFIGTDVTGSLAVGNGNVGVSIRHSNSTGNLISNNLISANSGGVSAKANDTCISGNLIGTDADGTQLVGANGGTTVVIVGDNNVFGIDSSGTGAGNVVVGSAVEGVYVVGDFNRVAGNFIGTDTSGQLDLGNQRHGLVIADSSSGNHIAQNVIAFNGANDPTYLGISIGTGTENLIQANSIYSNAGLGIDIAPAGPNPNDDGDADTGGNDLQNYPILTLVEGGGSTRVVGVLNSTPLQDFELEFFASADVDSSGHGEGERFLGGLTISTDSTNQASFDAVLLEASFGGEWITATATDSQGNTSEFSVALQITNIDPIADAGPDQSLPCVGNGQALVTLDGTASIDPDGDTLEYQWSVPAGIVLDDPTSATPSGSFPLGITLATLSVIDGKGGVDVDDVEIRVVDIAPPEVSCTTDLMMLWPPNHQMEQVEVYIDATDDCTNPADLVLLMVTAESNEPDDDNGVGDGESTGDVDGQDGYSAPVDIAGSFAYDPFTASFAGSLQLRAERNGTGSGRTYTITAYLQDTAGNLAITSCVVVVPHDKRKK